ncbi:MAG: DotI/IcmL/TraM family protein [Bdellovibrionales bacterium]
MKRIYFSIFIAAALFVWSSSPVKAGLLEFLFPSLKEEEYDPAKDMVAEFAVGTGVDVKSKLEQLPVDAVPLVNPHLLSQEVGEWIMNAAGEAMNFDAGTKVAGLSSGLVLFDRTAIQQYQTFLAENNIQKVMEDGRYNIRSYVDQTPLLLNEGVVNERYRWLFRVPVVVTYLDKDMQTYKGNEAALIQRAILNIQLGRVFSADKPDGLQIEQWSGKLTAFEEASASR